MLQTLTLHIEVEYETNGEHIKTLENLLENAAQHLASEGLLSQGSQAEVETWNAWVTKT